MTPVDGTALRRGAGRLRLSPLRGNDSMALDQVPGGLPTRLQGVSMPPYRRWEEFRDWFLYEREGEDGPEGWMQGEHLTAVGRTRSGKSKLIRALMPRRDYVVMFATKREDPVYAELESDGFVMMDTFEPGAEDFPHKVIFKPPLKGTDAEDILEQREAFRDAITTVYIEGGWCVWCNEVRYVTETLKLKGQMEVLWMQGRTLGVTIVAETQRPVSIPILAFDAQHLFYFKTATKRDIDVMTEYTGINTDVTRVTVPRLPKHEALYIDTVTDEIFRTKVSLPR